MSKYLNLEKQLVRLYRLGLNNEEVIKQFLLTACTEDVTAVRHGKWIDVERYEGILYRCSICEDKRHRHTTIKYNYCPDCGAKMDLEGDIE